MLPFRRLTFPVAAFLCEFDGVLGPQLQRGSGVADMPVSGAGKTSQVPPSIAVLQAWTLQDA